LESGSFTLSFILAFYSTEWRKAPFSTYNGTSVWLWRMGTIMRQGFWLAALVAASVTIAPASFAWEIQHTGTNPDGSPRFSDPDETTDAMANHLTGGDGGNSSVMHFGSTTMTINGGSGYNSGMSPALQQQFFGNPAVSRTVPNSNW